MELDFECLARELVIAVRGKYSQAQLNNKMKFRTNQIYRWESGQAKITWPDFARLCAAARRPFGQALRNGLTYYGPTQDTRMLVQRLAADLRQAELARLAGVTRTVATRWLSGRAVPTLAHVLRLIPARDLSLAIFIGALIDDPKRVPSLARELASEDAEREVHFRLPYVGAVILCLRTPGYAALPRHEDGFIARHLGITIEQEREAITQLVTAGAISLRRERYVPRRVSISLSGDRAGNLALRKYWAGRGLALLNDAPPGPLMWPQLVFNTTPEKYAVIWNKLLKLYDEIVHLTANEEIEADEIYLFSAQLLDTKTLPSA